MFTTSGFWEVMTIGMVGVMTVALISVLMSRNSQTPQVVQSWFSGWGNLLGSAEAATTGAAGPYNYSYPGTTPSGGAAFIR